MNPSQQIMTNSMGDMFSNASQVMVTQEWAAVEMCGIEAKNRYRISVPMQGQKEGATFLYITEESQCLERVCCGPNRTLTLKVHEGNSKDGPVVMRMHKPFSCQACCFLRPTFKVYGPGGMPNDQIGSIDDPCRCCYMDQRIFSKDGNVAFTTGGTMCQPGLCCPCCCGVDFNVTKNGSKVGSIEKIAQNLTEMCMKTNRFMIKFDKVQDNQERRLLLASAMLLDLEYFEQQK